MPAMTVKEIFQDPDFQILPRGEQVKVLAHVDPDFKALPPVEQERALAIHFDGQTPGGSAKQSEAVAGGEGVSAGDFSRALAIGLGQLGALGGRVLQWLGADDTGRDLEKLYQGRIDLHRADQGDEYKRRAALPFLSEKEGEVFGAGFFDPVTWANMGLESLPSTALGAGAGGFFTLGLTRLGLSKGLSALVGAAASEGALGGAQSAKDIEDLILATPHETLQTTSREYQQAIRDGLDQEAARKAVASVAARRAGLLVGLGTAALGAPSGSALAKALGGESGKSMLRTMFKQGFLEMTQEGPQSGLEQVAQNLAQKRHLDHSQDLGEGVAEAMAKGAGVGGLMGFALGGGAHEVGSRQVRNRNLLASAEENAAAPEGDPQAVEAPETSPAAPATPAPEVSRQGVRGAIELEGAGPGEMPLDAGDSRGPEPRQVIDLLAKSEDRRGPEALERHLSQMGPDELLDLHAQTVATHDSDQAGPVLDAITRQAEAWAAAPELPEQPRQAIPLDEEGPPPTPLALPAQVTPREGPGRRPLAAEPVQETRRGPFAAQSPERPLLPGLGPESAGWWQAAFGEQARELYDRLKRLSGEDLRRAEAGLGDQRVRDQMGPTGERLVEGLRWFRNKKALEEGPVEGQKALYLPAPRQESGPVVGPSPVPVEAVASERLVMPKPKSLSANSPRKSRNALPWPTQRIATAKAEMEEVGIPVEAAKANAKLMGARARAWASETGQAPDAWPWWDRISFSRDDGVVGRDGTKNEGLGGGQHEELFQAAPPADSPEFRRWFGDSKVVDKAGRPLVVYHGTEAYFEAFDPGLIEGEPGFFFTTDKEATAEYGEHRLEVYLRAVKPYETTVEGWSSGRLPSLAALKRSHYDAVHILDEHGEWASPGSEVWMVLEPTQIKSVYNRGTWDPGEANTLHQGLQEAALAAGRKLAVDLAAWKGTLKAFLAKKIGRGDWLRLGGTPDVLQKLGAKDLPLVMGQRNASKVLHTKHQLPLEIVEQLPALLADPVAVFDSATMANSLVALTEAQHNGGPVLSAVHINFQDSVLEVNEVATLFAKDHNPQAWLSAQVHSGRLRYLNKKKAALMQRTGGLQLPRVMHQRGKNRILTEQDIVKPVLPGDDLAQGPHRGSVQFQNDGRAVITFFKASDLSTAPHEIYHVFRRDLEDLAARPEASGNVKNDWEAVCAFVGAKPGQKWTVEQDEKFADAGIRYLADGEAPIPELKGVFERFRQWLLAVYRSLRGLPGSEISPAMRGVMDRLLAPAGEIKAKAGSVVEISERPADNRGRGSAPQGLQSPDNLSKKRVGDAAKLINEEAGNGLPGLEKDEKIKVAKQDKPSDGERENGREGISSGRDAGRQRLVDERTQEPDREAPGGDAGEVPSEPRKPGRGRGPEDRQGDKGVRQAAENGSPQPRSQVAGGGEHDSSERGAVSSRGPGDGRGRGGKDNQVGPGASLGPQSVDHPAPGRPGGENDRPAPRVGRGADHRIGPDDQLVPAGIVTRAKANIQAVKLLKELQAQSREATPDEKKTLAQFTGWGALGQEVFRPEFVNAARRQARTGHAGWIPGGKEAEYRKWLERYGRPLMPEFDGLLTDEEWAAAEKSTLNAHYTSREIIEAMWSAVQRLGFNGGRVLEPSAGVGHFFGLMPQALAEASRLQAVELDPITGGILEKLYPSADVQITGFEKAKRLAPNSKDLVISNVPFGNFGVFDKSGNPYADWSIHNYFIGKALDVARPGGLVAVITSHWTMDAASGGQVRQHLLEHADLVGAVRLPSTAFEKNAGTEVTTDILFFRKKTENRFAGAQEARTIEDVPAEGVTAQVNEYFVNHPEMVLGRHSLAGKMHRTQDEYTLKPDQSRPLSEQLADAIGRLPAGVMGRGASDEATAAAPERARAEAGMRDNALVEKDGKVYLVDDGELVPPSWSGVKAKMARAKDYIQVRDAAKKLIESMLDDGASDGQITADRAQLNRTYDAFVERHGPIGLDKNNYLRDDVDYPTALALEVNKGDEQNQDFQKGDIFFRRTVQPFRYPDRAENAQDALKASLVYKGGVDTAFVGRLLGDLSPEEAGARLLKEELVFEDPAGGLLVTTEEYLSGNVRAKLDRARRAAAEEPAYARNVKALEKVQPEPLEVEEIHFRLGSYWIPPEQVQRFIKDALDVTTTVTYEVGSNGDEPVSGWEVRYGGGGMSAKATDTYGAPGADAIKLIRDSLNLKKTVVYRTEMGPDGKPKQVKDKDATLAAQEKQRQVQELFKKWVLGDSEASRTLAERYNELFNGTVVRAFAAPEIDHYPGANPAVSLRDHQKRAVGRMLQESGVLAHGVGSGKTFAMITAAMEMRRIGTANKPLIAVQNSTLQQFAAEALRLYPGAKVLAPTETQRTAKNRRRLLSQIATGDWDLVVIPHSFLNMVANSPRREAAFIREQLAEIEDAIEQAARKDDRRGPTAKNLAKIKLKKEERLKELLAIPKDEHIWFEEMGIDALFVDEAHEYKRCEFFSKMDNVKGLDRGVAKRSSDLLLKVRFIQEKTGGKNVIFASGTPISNTLAELWTFMRYTRPDLLAANHVALFDDFASTFCDTSVDLEETETGDFRTVERFNRYVNGPELIALWRSVADVVLTDDLDLPGRPALEGGRIQEVPLERPEELGRYIEELRRERQAWERLTGAQKREQSHVPLVIFGKARKLAIDLRLIDPAMPDVDASKTNAVVGRVFNAWQDLKPERGVQAVFSDMYQSPDKSFNLFHDIRDKLIARGVPAKEIAIINDLPKGRLEDVFKRVNAGKVRVVMGSTAKMGVGVNIQERLKFAHHVDAPLRPMDFEQRNGRIVRQGNRYPEVGVYVYGVKNTLDSVNFNRLQMKQKFINQIMRGEVTGRSFDDPFSTEQASFEEMMAAFSDNQLVRERFRLENQVRKLEGLEAADQRARRQAREKVAVLEEVVPKREEELKRLLAAAAEAAKALPDGKLAEVQFQGSTMERKDFTAAVKDLVDRATADWPDRVGAHTWETWKIADKSKFYVTLPPVSVGPFSVEACLEPAYGVGKGDRLEYAGLKINGDLVHEDLGAVERLSFNSPAGFVQALGHALSRLEANARSYEARLNRDRRDLKELKEVASGSFPEASELAKARRELEDVLEALEKESRQDDGQGDADQPLNFTLRGRSRRRVGHGVVTDASRSLESHLAKAGQPVPEGSFVEAVGLRVRHERVGDDQAGTPRTLAARVADAYGKELRYFEVTDPEFDSLAGTYQTPKNTVWVHAATPLPHVAITIHELFHGLQVDRPDLYGGMLVDIERMVRDLPDFQARFGPFKNDASARAELLASVAGDMALNPSFWWSVLGDKPGPFKRFVAYAKTFFLKLTARLRGDAWGRASEVYFTDIKAVRQAILDAFAEYRKSQQALRAAGRLPLEQSAEHLAAHLKAANYGRLPLGAKSRIERMTDPVYFMKKEVDGREPLVINKLDTGDLKRLRVAISLPHWIAKAHAGFRALYERQLSRLEERQTKLAEALRQVGSFMGDDLSEQDLAAIRKLIWKYDGLNIKGVDDVEGSPKFLEQKSPEGVVTISVNPEYRERYAKWLGRQGLGAGAERAMLEIRASLDQDFVTVFNSFSTSRVPETVLAALKSSIFAQPNYFPHVREGNYAIVGYTVGPKGGRRTVYREHFDAAGKTLAKSKAERRIGELKKRYGHVAQWEILPVERLPEDVYASPLDLAAMEQLVNAAVIDSAADPANRERIKDSVGVILEGLADSMKARGWAGHAIRRQNIPGHETEDIRKVLFRYKAGLNGWLTKAEAARDFAKLLGRINSRKHPVEYRYALNYVRDMLRNADQVDRIVGNIKGAAYVWYLGGMVKTAVLNLTQNIVAGVPRLSMEAKGSGGRYFQAAMKAVTVQASEGKGLAKDEQRLVRELFDAGVLAEEFLREVQGRVADAVGSKLWWQTVKILGWPMAAAERFNRVSLALAAYRLARDGKIDNKATLERLGMNPGDQANHQQAKDFAAGIVRDAHFVYGKANLPQAFRTETVGRLASPAYTFRTFSHNLLSLWAWMLRQARSGQEVEQGRAAAALLRSFGGIAALGGLTALPFYGTLAAIIAGLTDDDEDLNEKLREHLPEGTRDLVSYGLPALFGISFGGSLAMETPGLRALESRKGLEDAFWSDFMSELVGVPADLVRRSDRAIKAAEHLAPYRALEELSPNFIKSIMSSWRLISRGQTTLSGRPVNDPGQPGPRRLSGGEAAAKALGFQPLGQRKSWDMYRSRERSRQLRADKAEEIAAALFKHLTNKDREAYQADLQAWMEWNRQAIADKKLWLVITRQDLTNRLRARKQDKLSKRDILWGVSKIRNYNP